MKVAIVYTSIPNDDTYTLLEKLSNGNDVDLIDGQLSMKIDLTEYDMIGVVVGDCPGKFFKSFLNYISKYFPEGRETFLISTYEGNSSFKAVEKILNKKNYTIKGRYYCKTQEVATTGFSRLFRRRGEKLPSDEGLAGAVEFYQQMVK